MKVAVDVHGVLDSNPFFKEMARLFVAAGHEVHILTGAQLKGKLKKHLEDFGLEWGVHFTHFFSISDNLLRSGVEVRWEDPNNPWFDDNEWNMAKAAYCSEHNIDIHFDDSDEYWKYFTTPYYMKKS